MICFKQYFVTYHKELKVIFYFKLKPFISNKAKCLIKVKSLKAKPCKYIKQRSSKI